MNAVGRVLPGGSYAYTPFGVVASGNMPVPFGFTGELQSQGLVYLRARWYDPSSEVFIIRDPFAGFPEQPYSLHPYQYGYSNPMLWTDPSGEKPTPTPTPEPSNNQPHGYPPYVMERHKDSVPETATFLTHYEAKEFQKVLANASQTLAGQAQSERNSFVCILTIIGAALGPAAGVVAGATGASAATVASVGISAELMGVSAAAAAQMNNDPKLVSARTGEAMEVMRFLNRSIDAFVDAVDTVLRPQIGSNDQGTPVVIQTKPEDMRYVPWIAFWRDNTTARGNSLPRLHTYYIYPEPTSRGVLEEQDAAVFFDDTRLPHYIYNWLDNIGELEKK